MKKQKADSICNSELYGIQENEENEIQKQSIDDDTCHNSCQSSCDTESHALKPITPYNAFLLIHEHWIDFLNDKETLEKDIIQFENLFLDLTRLSDSTEKWQIHNKLLDDNGDLKFKSDKELKQAIHSYMYENLRAIYFGEQNELKPVDKVGLKEVNALLSLRMPIILDSKARFNTDFQAPLSTVIYFLAKCLECFAKYIKEALEGISDFKIGVCPYKKLRDKKECGLVYISRWNQLACDEHHEKYKRLNWVNIRKNIAKKLNANPELRKQIIKELKELKEKNLDQINK